MPRLCQLADPDAYRPCTWDLIADSKARPYWLNLFYNHVYGVEKLIRAALPAGDTLNGRISAFIEDYHRQIDRLRADPTVWGELTVIRLCAYREELLARHGFHDPYAATKQHENNAAARLYPDIIANLDRLSSGDRPIELIRNLLAGNIFDLGSPVTAKQYHDEGLDFFATRAGLRPRPWFIDHVDALAETWLRRPKPYAQVLFFVDNAGADVVLGAVPLARQLARWGARVVLAANSSPSLNDITASELPELLGVLAEADSTLRGLLDDDRIAAIESGCRTALIDLGQVSEECDKEAARSDLLILEGMGRAIESNWHAPFRCDCLRIALLKDAPVAAWVGGELFDPVVRFDLGMQ